MFIALLAACGPSTASIQVPGVKATIPPDAIPADGALKDQLTAGTLRHDPAADVEVKAVAPKGKPDQLLYAVMRVHRSPGMDGGMTVEEWTKVNVQALQDHGRSKHIEVPHEVKCADGVCLFEYTMGGRVYHRSRMSSEDGRLLTLSCQCTAEGCLEKCSIPAP